MMVSYVSKDARACMADERLQVRRQLLEVPRAHGAAARCQLGCAACFLQWNTSAEHIDAQKPPTTPCQVVKCNMHHGKQTGVRNDG